MKITVPVLDAIATGKNIRRLTNSSGLTAKQVAEVVGLTTPSSLYNWMNAKNMPSVDNLLILAAIFKVPIEDVLVTKQREVEYE